MNMLSIDLKSLGHRLCRFKPGSGYQNKKSRCRPVCDGFFISQADHPSAGQDRSRERKRSKLTRLVPGNRPGQSAARYQ